MAPYRAVLDRLPLWLRISLDVGRVYGGLKGFGALWALVASMIADGILWALITGLPPLSQGLFMAAAPLAIFAVAGHVGAAAKIRGGDLSLISDYDLQCLCGEIVEAFTGMPPEVLDMPTRGKKRKRSKKAGAAQSPELEYKRQSEILAAVETIHARLGDIHVVINELRRRGIVPRGELHPLLQPRRTVKDYVDAFSRAEIELAHGTRRLRVFSRGSRAVMFGMALPAPLSDEGTAKNSHA